MTRRRPVVGEPLMTPGEVKAAFGVSYTSLGRWIDAGKLVALRTPGGARRYRAADVQALLNHGTDADRALADISAQAPGAPGA